jgi:hypothetical protein
MSKYSVDFLPAEDYRLAVWAVCEVLTSNDNGSISRIVFRSTKMEEAFTMLEEFRICEQGSEYDGYRNQPTEFDYV